MAVTEREVLRAGDSVEVRVAEESGRAVLEVQDTGSGIDPADLPRVWDRFFRGDRSRRRATGEDDGAGLGLAIVRGVIEAHGGTVSVASLPEHGSTFAFLLPPAPRSEF